VKSYLNIYLNNIITKKKYIYIWESILQFNEILYDSKKERYEWQKKSSGGSRYGLLSHFRSVDSSTFSKISLLSEDASVF